MKNYWKPFVGWVTGLKANQFTWARLKLTVLYSTVIVIVVIGYIVVLQREIQRYTLSTAQEIPDGKRRTRFIERSARVTVRALYGIEPEDVLTMVVIIGISYVLAGTALQPIRETLRQQKQFLENTAHQLKTPLAIMKTEMEVFLKDKKNVTHIPGVLLRRKASIKSNLEEIERIDRVLDDFLTIARVDAHLEKYVLKPVDLTDLVRLHMKKMSLYAKHRGIRFAVHAQNPHSVMMDAGKFEHALHNILINAINYSLENGRVTVTIRKNASLLTLTITDAGIGIARDELPKVFDRFFRGSNYVSHRVTGSGLGLYIAKQIIEKHNGTISIESALGKGTTVAITLPLAQTS